MFPPFSDQKNYWTTIAVHLRCKEFQNLIDRQNFKLEGTPYFPIFLNCDEQYQKLFEDHLKM